ncbi:hypothetical protein F4777DRAFT_516048 [Nemania sp. FL0916]|nr:hypothetical protein F4777DRAFT_516048 [Nemania sp. FL0916]
MARSQYVVPFVAILSFIAGPPLVQSLTMEYCASVNTGSTPTNSSIFQSNGLCHDFCFDKAYALAIVQYQDCWCSDFVPAKSSQVDTDKCNEICPGYKYESCGADGLFGYIALSASPSGTAGGSPTPSPSTSAGQTSTSVDTSTSATSTIHSTTTSTSTTMTTSSPAPTTKTTSTTPAPSPTTSVKTVTAGGTVSLETVTVTPTVTPTSAAESSGASTSKGLGTGAIVGIVIGVLGVVAIIAGIAIFLWMQRRRHQREEELASRPQSHLSSHLSGSGGMMGTPTTPMASVWDGENTPTGRRNSRLMPHDPRMDPFAVNIYGRFENKSRESINTLQDNQDYSRKVLRTTNPDPPDA